MTRLGTVWPGAKLRLEALGRETPVGNTVRKLGAVGPVTVTLRTTAATPAVGMPRVPATWTLIVAPAPSGCAGTAPVPSRVSSAGWGTTGLYKPSGPGVAAGVAT